jgi:endonuclease/exonuclease/phosphatase family metal-dependent hydrolase
MAASRQGQSIRALQELFRLWLQLPVWLRVVTAVAAVTLLIAVFLYLRNPPSKGGGPGPEIGDEPLPPVTDPGAGTYVFCFWNVENLFDDRNDGRTGAGDNVYDPWMADDAEARERKLDRLCDVLLSDELNGGKGPDILALCEIESERAAELLRHALNTRLKDPKLSYGAHAGAGPGAGRHIGPALLARLPVKGAGQLGNHQRIMETRVQAGGAELVVIASHWSSRISDKTGKSRAKYADVIYGRFHQLYKANEGIKLLVCGDFNDDPTDASVADHLRAIGDVDAVRSASRPKLYNPFAALFEQGQLTQYHSPKGHVFDQICLSPGLLGGGGWSYVEGSARIVPKFATRAGNPNRFGSRGDKRAWGSRGASDHFPVTVKLRAGNAD